MASHPNGHDYVEPIDGWKKMIFDIEDKYEVFCLQPTPIGT